MPYVLAQIWKAIFIQISLIGYERQRMHINFYSFFFFFFSSFFFIRKYREFIQKVLSFTQKVEPS